MSINKDELKKAIASIRLERLKKAIAHLIFLERVSQKSTQKDIAEQMGYNNQVTISNALNGNVRYLTESFLGRFCKTYDIFNLEWLIAGEGDMLSTAFKALEQGAAPSIISENSNELYLETKCGIKYYNLGDNKYKMRVPFVPYNAYARYACETSEPIQQEKEEWGEIDFIVDRIGHGSYMAFEIKGDSMDDDSKRSFAEGDKVLVRELDQIHWKDGIRYNQYPFWIIVLSNTILCKEIIDHNIESGEITCHSLNPSPEYSDFTISLNKIYRLFNVVQKVPAPINY